MSGMIRYWQRWALGKLLVVGGAIAFSGKCTLAQIAPDTTLGVESSVITPTNINGINSDRIDGGAIRSANLFHSFQEFNIEQGRGAYFTNPAGIENILSRVTGGNASNILGTLGVLGNANLFLINPSGIIFGKNASLDVKGSFVGTTASAIGFGNSSFFSALNAETSSSLLTVNPSALLFNQIRAASIQNNSVTGLRVPDGRSLLLVGGDINMDGGRLFAFGGRVELGGSSGVGTVGLNGDGNNLSLSFPDSVERSDVSLSNDGRVTVIAGDGGSIAINARNLEMTGGSFLLAGIESGLGSDNSKAGNIEVNATGAINLNNRSSINNLVLVEASGQGGDVNISASTLRVEGGAQVGPSTFGEGKGGNFTIDAQDVQLIGESADGQLASGLFASAEQNSRGDAGDLTIKTNTLLVRDGAQVSVGTFSEGKGGNLTVDAKEVQLIGTSADGRFSSGLSTSAGRNSTGNAGDLTIKTNTLLVRDGANVNTGTFGASKGGSLTVDAQNVQLIGISANGQIASGLSTSAERNSTGNAGDLTIKTNTLLVRDGAQVGAGTFGAGKGGSLTVDAKDVQLISSGLFASAEANSTGNAGDLTIKTNTLLVRDGAQVGAGTFSQGKGGNLTIDAKDVQLIGTSVNPQFASGLSASAQPDSTGDAGNLTIKTNTLLVQDGAIVSVQSLGTGTAGNMILNARSIRLNNDALLTANTRSAKLDPNREQATININSQDLIMRRGSNIRTNATGENVIGGNINIDTDFLLAVENSDISANSTDSRGGQVKINATGIFGTQFRDARTPESDITATGGSPELNGTVEINTPDIDPNSGLINLPTVPLDTEVSQICQPRSAENQSSFIITGRGGLPPNPRTEPLTPDAVQVDWVTLKPSTQNRSNSSVSSKRTTATPEKIVEATGWVRNEKGEVVLTANPPTVTPHGSWQKPADCSAVQSNK